MINSSIPVEVEGVIDGLYKQNPLEVQRYVALRYLLSRLGMTLHADHPHPQHLPRVAEYLGIDLDMALSEQLLRRYLPRDVASSVERVLFGEPWTDDGAMPLSLKEVY